MMPSLEKSPLVSVEWLAENLDSVKLIDASWRMPGEPAGRIAYDERHIPGAIFFDIDEIADRTTDLPHMLPTAGEFSSAVGGMGISSDDTVVIYDDVGIFSSPRAWWTFRAMGHQHVVVLNGGLKAWVAAGLPVTDETPDAQPASYRATLDRRLISDATDIRAAADRAQSEIVDARSADRFSGRAPEPRAGLISGAMPGAKNAPFDEFLQEDGTMKTPHALRAVFENAGVDLERPVISTCGSGVTAAVLALALESLGHDHWSVYDGSWAEWGKETHDRVAYPVVAGEA
jgi:thiosulfate/3-mercaptopyruvate sulfurtransferase